MILKIKSLTILSALLTLASAPVYASWIAFEQLPTGNSNYKSHHAAGGPILADDFISYLPTGNGTVQKVEWWGSFAQSDQWELTFNNYNPDNLSVPNVDDDYEGGLQHFVTASGMDSDGDGIWHYSALWDPQDWNIFLPDLDWFSVANFSSDWNWALAQAPTVGGQVFDAVRSTGNVCGNGGPHCGPWQSIDGADLAFRITAVPEPGTIFLLSAGLIGLAGLRRKSKKLA